MENSIEPAKNTEPVKKTESELNKELDQGLDKGLDKGLDQGLDERLDKELDKELVQELKNNPELLKEPNLELATNKDSSSNQNLMQKIFNTLGSQDSQQKINMLSSLSGEFFKIAMATLLALFVPQSCAGQVCSFSQNFINLSIYNTFVLVYNFATLGYFIWLYYIEVDREKWMITHLDYDENQSEYYLYNFRESHKDIFDRLQQRNKIYLFTYNILKYLYISNFIFSAILVFHYYYLDYRTATTLVTNVILCWSKVMKGYDIAKKSVDKEIGLSYYNTVNLSFNTIDKDYEKNILNKNITESESQV